MSEPLTPLEFVELVLELGTGALAQGFDVPELWRSLGDLPRSELEFLHVYLKSLASNTQLTKEAEVVLTLVTELVGYHAERVDGASLRKAAEDMLLLSSQSPFLAGFWFHVSSLLHPDNERLKLDEWICTTPFSRLDVCETTTHLCCASFLHKSAGDPNREGHLEVWNSESAREIRRSILDGSYRFCNKSACPNIQSGNLSRKSELLSDPSWAAVLRDGTGAMERPPERVTLAYDKQCNLSCPSCRTSLLSTNEVKRKQLDDMTELHVRPLLSTAKLAYICGSGDPFASRTFRKLLGWISAETCPDLKVVLMTNGMLLTETEWMKFPNLRGRVSIVKVSVDAARRETHELLRRGSRWDVMMENLPFIGRLREAGDIEDYELVMVVQKENYREMGEFVELARAVGANRVYFERLTNWGTFDLQTFRDKAVFLSNHPEHARFLEQMDDPRLRDPIVVRSSFAEFLPAETSSTPPASAVRLAASTEVGRSGHLEERTGEGSPGRPPASQTFAARAHETS